MVYLEYERCKKRYHYAHLIYDQILREKEDLFQMTQPKSPVLDTERTSGGETRDKFEAYVAKKDQLQIDQRLQEAKQILDERWSQILLKEEELRASKEIHDVIYCMRVLDRYKMQRIMKSTNYSRSQVYRYLSDIYVAIKGGTK